MGVMQAIAEQCDGGILSAYSAEDRSFASITRGWNASKDTIVLARTAFDPSHEPLAVLEINSALRAQIVEHLRDALPNEGCGLIAVDDSRDGEAMYYYPGENLDESPNRYTMNPTAVIAAFRHMEARNWRLGAIVHSHPRTAATPSMTDLREAHYPSALMVICSFAQAEPDLRAWAIAPRERGYAQVLGERPVVAK
jgi:proteasome lid subunit RPN8/RPN11